MTPHAKSNPETTEVQLPPFCPQKIGGICYRPGTCAKCGVDWQNTHNTVDPPPRRVDPLDPRPDCVKWDEYVTKQKELHTPSHE